MELTFLCSIFVICSTQKKDFSNSNSHWGPKFSSSGDRIYFNFWVNYPFKLDKLKFQSNFMYVESCYGQRTSLLDWNTDFLFHNSVTPSDIPANTSFGVRISQGYGWLEFWLDHLIQIY